MGNASDILVDARCIKADEAKSIGLASDIIEKDSWDEKRSNLELRCSKLSDFSKQQLLTLTAPDTRGADIATIVHTAGRPGLQARIKQYKVRNL